MLGESKMVLFYLVPVFLSLCLLGAHFFRAGQIAPAVLALLVLFFLFIRRSWANLIVRFVLLAGAVEWLRTLVVLVIERQTLGLPWVRLVLILGAVILLTVCSAFCLKAEKLRPLYYRR